MLDTVTVVFQDELEVLQTQARSLDLYCHDMDLQTIFVIVNDDDHVANQIDTAWWGSLQSQVRIIPRSSFACQFVPNGWVSQQVLKLLASSLSSSTWSMVLDAKTFFITHMSKISDRPAVGQMDIYPVFEPSRQIVNQLFGIELTKQLGPGGVPFIINPQEARNMIAWIKNHTQQDFATWFQDLGMLTEFILYSGWIYYRYSSLDHIYDISRIQIKPCNLCHSEIDMFDQKFAKMRLADTVSIHRNAWTQLTRTQQAQYTHLLRDRGIQSLKAMVMVAHPDDCVIFAYSFMHRYKQLDWTVCYLTYTESDARGHEFAEFWQRRGVATKFLGYVDDYRDIEANKISFDTQAAAENIRQAILGQDVVLTHDHCGDYGHLHHVFVNQTVCQNHNRVVCFAGLGQGNVKYVVDPGVYSLDELPLHRDVIAGFHQYTHANEYTINERTKKIL
jgi:beta-galactosidase GanA